MATVEELQKASEQSTTGVPATPAATTATAPAATAGNSVANGAYNTARTDSINTMYDAQKQQRLNELETAYNNSVSEYDAVAAKIPQTYNAQANNLAVQYERNRRNFNQQAATSGINTGTASQAALAQNSEYQRDFAGIAKAQTDATTEADRQRANLTATYQTNISSAIANNDYEKAAALLDEYNNGYQRDLAMAQNLAQFGDFTGYASLYGQEQADGMKGIWKVQNPDVAFNTGNMTAEEYRMLTGAYPIGYDVAIQSGASYDQANTGAGEYMRDVYPTSRASIVAPRAATTNPNAVTWEYASAWGGAGGYDEKYNAVAADLASKVLDSTDTPVDKTVAPDGRALTAAEIDAGARYATNINNMFYR